MNGEVRLSNGLIDVVVSTAFGPRILRYGYVGGENLLAPDNGDSMRTALGEWRFWGGHRLWVAPELLPGTYAPDMDPVHTETGGPLCANFLQRPDAAGIEKHLAITLAPDRAVVTLSHTIINRTCWPIRVAPWAITAVASDGLAVIPQPPYRSHDEDLLPARAIVQWSFTDFSDPRWSLGPMLIRLQPDPGRRAPQKIGVANREGWCALLRRGQAFLKRFGWDADAVYPDHGSNNELYTAGDFLEMESLGPLRVLDPGAPVTHVERWFLFRDLDWDDLERSQYETLQALLPQTALNS